MALDTDVLIIGAGMSGLGLAVQLVRKYGTRNFEIVEKEGDVGGTWLVNTYPGCGCDVASHFYSYSFALNPNWSRKFSMQSEIHAYFRGVAERYNILPHVRFHTSVEEARWNDVEQQWEVMIEDRRTKERIVRRCKVLVSAVGSLSVPKNCDIPGVEKFQGRLFHSAKWDHDFDWADKNVVVLGNGCSATQFVPVLAATTRRLTQFARSPQFLAERPNPEYGNGFRAVMRYVPGAMRVYRFWLYAWMERDFAGFEVDQTGAAIRQGLKEENERYVKKMAPATLYDALIPDYEIGCKRKVMDTDYLSSLHRSNVELETQDLVMEIVADGVRTRSGRFIHADTIILATGFEVAKMLAPMKIYGHGSTTSVRLKDVSLHGHWDMQHGGAPQAYFGTCVPSFPNFFTLMGPNTVTGHLSVIYTIECQISFVLRLLEPIMNTMQQQRREGSSSSSISRIPGPTVVEVTSVAATRDSTWLQTKLRRLVWNTGCANWALDPRTGLNIAMYPQYQFWFWWRSVFIPRRDFEYVDCEKQRRSLWVGGWKTVRRWAFLCGVVGVVAAGSGFVGIDGLDLIVRQARDRIAGLVKK